MILILVRRQKKNCIVRVLNMGMYHRIMCSIVLCTLTGRCKMMDSMVTGIINRHRIETIEYRFGAKEDAITEDGPYPGQTVYWYYRRLAGTLVSISPMKLIRLTVNALPYCKLRLPLLFIVTWVRHPVWRDQVLVASGEDMTKTIYIGHAESAREHRYGTKCRRPASSTVAPKSACECETRKRIFT